MKLSALTKKMIRVVAAAALIIIAAGAVWYSIPGRYTDALMFSLGVLLTSALNAWKLVLLERSVQRLAEMNDASAGKNHSRIQGFARMLLTAVVLAGAGLVARFTPYDSCLWGAVAGIFTLQIAAYSAKWMKLDDGG